MDPYSDFDDVFTSGSGRDRQHSTPSPKLLEAPQPLRSYPTTAYDNAGLYGSGGLTSAASNHGMPAGMGNGAYGGYGCTGGFLDRPTSAPFGGSSCSSDHPNHSPQQYLPKLTGDALGSRGSSPAVTVLRGYDGGHGGSFLAPPSVPETPEPLLQIDSPFIRGSEYRREKTFQKHQQHQLQDGKKGNWWGVGQKSVISAIGGTAPAATPAPVLLAAEGGGRVPVAVMQHQQQLWSVGGGSKASDAPFVTKDVNTSAASNGPAWLAAAARAPAAMAEGFLQAVRPSQQQPQQQQPQGPEPHGPPQQSVWQQPPLPPPRQPQQQQQWPRDTQPQWWHQQPPREQQQAQQQQQQAQQQQQQPAAAFKTAVSAVTAAAAATASNFWWARQPDGVAPRKPQTPMERQVSADTTIVQPWQQPWPQQHHQHQLQRQASEPDDPFAPPRYSYGHSSNYGNYGGGGGADAAAGAAWAPEPSLPGAIVALRVRVTGTAERGEGREAHTAYEMQAEALEQRGTSRRWTVSRRYREFQELHKSLQAALSSRPEVTLPQLPPKEIFGGRHKDVVSKRLAGLPQYIDGVLAIDNIRGEECVQLFFGLPVTVLPTPTANAKNAKLLPQLASAVALPPPLSAFARAYGRESVRFEGFLRLKDWWGPPKESINLFELGVVGWSRSWVVICGGPLLYCFKGQEADPSKPQWSLPPAPKNQRRGGSGGNGNGDGTVSAIPIQPRIMRVDLRGQNYEKDQKRLFAVEWGKRTLLCQVESENELQRWAAAIDPTAKLSQSPQQQRAADAKAAQSNSIELKGKDGWRITHSGVEVSSAYYRQNSEQSVWEGMTV